MDKKEGIHIYININNLNSVLLDEESGTGRVEHTLHAMNLFFSSVEQYGKQLSRNLVVEKITGSRLHLYTADDVTASYEELIKLSAFSFNLINYINAEIPKYKTLKKFHISIGAAYGHFYVFEFNIEDYSEITSIGYVANLAAKIQSRCDNNELCISQTLYDLLSREKQLKFKMIPDSKLRKYNQSCYYAIRLSEVSSAVLFSNAIKESISDRANSINLGDIEFSDVRKKLDYSNLSTKQCKRLEGIPVFADVRGFTEKFNEDDSNLEEMTYRTQSILSTLYDVSTNFGGVHVQFQGDRELSLFHNIPCQTVDGVYQKEQTCYKTAVIASMRMIDAVKKYSVRIGVGEDCGKLFATKVGARGEKDNILLGETVINADLLEDKYAGENQIAISSDVYAKLKAEDSFLAQQFNYSGSCYITTVGYEQYVGIVSSKMLEESNRRNDYNSAWQSEDTNE
ncbi:MAG: hypothetical protein IKH20_11085 [Clostridiales bacterium]|nr:hypothetical protein [Clostridiales bacterium]